MQHSHPTQPSVSSTTGVARARADEAFLSQETGLRLPLILWRDIFIVVDEGSGTARDYQQIEEIVRERAREYPNGMGCLTIIPPNATPPPDEVRRAIKRALNNVTSILRGACWLVEGEGFRAASVRAALAGLRLFVRPEYATHITADLEDALRWMLDQLGSGQGVSISAGAHSIRRERDAVRASIRRSA